MPSFDDPFIEEVHRLLTELDTILFDWRQDLQNGKLLGEVFQRFHTIKGSLMADEYGEIAAFTHEVESGIDSIRSGKMDPTTEVVDLIIHARDHMYNLIYSDLSPEKEGDLTDYLIKSFQAMGSGPAGEAVLNKVAGTTKRRVLLVEDEPNLRKITKHFIESICDCECETARNGAEALGILEELGTIEAGKKANLILLRADPLKDIRNTRKIESVYLDGKLVHSETKNAQRTVRSN